MQPAVSRPEARPGTVLVGQRSFSPQTGTVLYPDDVCRYLRLKNAFTPEDLVLIGTTPPKHLTDNANRKSLICPLPGASIEEMGQEFSSLRLPRFKMTADHHRQDWVRERGAPAWVQIELTLRPNNHNFLRFKGERLPTAREQVALMLVCHEDEDLPSFMETPALHVTSTRSIDGFVITVRLYGREFRFLNASEQLSLEKPAVGLRL